MEPLILLIAGIPRAGKTTLAQNIEESALELTHVPLDSYIMPVPEGVSFLEWVKTPKCIDWSLLQNHLEILTNGKHCFSPKMNWHGKTYRVSEGGNIENGLGKKMTPNRTGYLLPGTHSFSFLFSGWASLRIYINTPDETLASRLEGKKVVSEAAGNVIAKHLGDNPNPLRLLERQADYVINGTLNKKEQISIVEKILKEVGPIDPSFRPDRFPM